MSQSTVQVTVALADKRTERFRRAGITVKKGEVTVLDMPPLTEEQLKQLQAEPKLAVKVVEATASENQSPPPENGQAAENTEQNDGDQADKGTGNNAQSGASQAVPENVPDINLMTIEEAFAYLEPDNEAHFTKSGKPDVKALEEILGRKVTAGERDQAWDAYQTQQGDGAE